MVERRIRRSRNMTCSITGRMFSLVILPSESVPIRVGLRTQCPVGFGRLPHISACTRIAQHRSMVGTMRELLSTAPA